MYMYMYMYMYVYIYICIYMYIYIGYLQTHIDVEHPQFADHVPRIFLMCFHVSCGVDASSVASTKPPRAPPLES